MFRAIGGAVALRGPLWRAPVAGFASGRRPRPTTPAPEKWDTEEVMGWLRANSPMDASMEEALPWAAHLVGIRAAPRNAEFSDCKIYGDRFFGDN